MIERVRMPRDNRGREIPNPVRYVCDVGHFHPSRKAAIKCNTKRKKASK